jgi:small subunit ribosomal protein S20
MANSLQAAKRNRQAVARRGRNMPLRTRFRGAVKAARRAIAGDDPQAARLAWQEMSAITDRVAAKGVIHPNKAARFKSRVAAALRSKFKTAPQTAPRMQKTAAKKSASQEAGKNPAAASGASQSAPGGSQAALGGPQKTAPGGSQAASGEGELKKPAAAE